MGGGGGGGGRPTAGNSPVLDQRVSGVSARGGFPFRLSLLRPWHICYAVMLNQMQTKEMDTRLLKPFRLFRGFTPGYCKAILMR